MPGADHVRGVADGGQMKGGAPRVVWLTLGADPQLISAHSAAERLNQLGRPCHLVWNPLTGQTVQLIPIVRAGLALGVAGDVDHEGPAGAAAGAYPTGPLAAQPNDGAADVHTEGRLCVQVGVVGFARAPFTFGADDRREGDPGLARLLADRAALACRAPGPVRRRARRRPQSQAVGMRRSLRRLPGALLPGRRSRRH